MKRFRQRFLIFIVFLFTWIFGLSAYADVKINNVNFDSSSAFMFLSTSNAHTTEPGEIFSTALKNPNRVFFDINGAILTRPNETWYFKGSEITQIRVSQFTTNPNVVRVVFYHTPGFNPKKISVINVKGNYLFKYGDIALNQTDFFESYRSEHAKESDYIEKAVYIPASEIQQVPSSQGVSAANVQKAFANALQNATQPTEVSKVVNSEVPNSFSWGKVFKLRTNYFLSRVDVKRGNILLLGLGRAEIEKPMYLSNPTRVVFDLPNTMVAKRFKNVEIQLSETETLKVGQFEPSKVRLVITTSTPKSYRPIYSNDGQGILLGHDYRLSGIKLYDKGAQTLKTTVSSINALTDVLKLDYAAPVVYSVKEADNNLELKIYNATGFNDEIFKKAIASTKLDSVSASKMNIGGVQYVFKLKQGADVNVYAREDGKQLKVVIKNKKQENVVTPNKDQSYKGCGLIVIDPGHGGIDAGAIRAGINEKDINLEVSKIVARILNKKGYKVDLTRWEDKTVSLQERVDFSDANKASVFVSIHVNSSVSSEPQGIETHWWTEDGHRLAKVVHESFASSVKAVDRGLVKSKFYVINHTKAKSILVEIGFLSNDNERNELITKDRKQKTAEGIAEGIIKFMKKEGIK